MLNNKNFTTSSLGGGGGGLVVVLSSPPFSRLLAAPPVCCVLLFINECCVYKHHCPIPLSNQPLSRWQEVFARWQEAFVDKAPCQQCQCTTVWHRMDIRYFRDMHFFNHFLLKLVHEKLANIPWSLAALLLRNACHFQDAFFNWKLHSSLKLFWERNSSLQHTMPLKVLQHSEWPSSHTSRLVNTLKLCSIIPSLMVLGGSNPFFSIVLWSVICAMDFTQLEGAFPLNILTFV